MKGRRSRILISLLFLVGLVAVLASSLLFPNFATASDPLLQPAPRQRIGSYDLFGKQLSPQQAALIVQNRGLNPADPNSYARIGAVQVTQQLVNRGRNIFLNRSIGDSFGLNRVFGFDRGIRLVRNDAVNAIFALNGRSTTNLKVRLSQDLRLGSRVFKQGTVINTGLDVERSQALPVGLNFSGNLTCAVCHVTLSPNGTRLEGVPNGDVNNAFLIALAPNSAAGFARLNLDPLDPKYRGNGKIIIDSKGNRVELPDPEIFERAFDDAVLDVPQGNFESSPDRLNNTNQIPNVFTFRSGPYLSDGQFAVGPFGGLSSVNNAVHSSEVNILAPFQLSEQSLGIDPEVYLGVALQNAADPSLRLPEGDPVKPSEWLRQVAPNPAQAELQDQVAVPGAGTYPNLRPSTFTYNGLVFSPRSNNPSDIASGPFLFAENAMSAYQNSLVPPPNKSPQNQQAILSGSAQRGAQVFRQARCATCHIPPFFTDNKIRATGLIGTNPVRARSRLKLNPLLVAPQIYALNTPIPIPPNARTISVPTTGIADSPTTLPKGILPNGGYKTPSLRGLYLSAPYLHDGGVAVRPGALRIAPNGTAQVVNAQGLGLTGTLSRGIPADAASSLRALIDRGLRARVVAANRANPALVNSNLDGSGHNFYVDRQAGFTPAQQTDLVNFLMALDDDPGRF